MPGTILIWEQNLPHAIQRIRLVRKVTQFFQKIKNHFLYRHRLSPFPFIPSRLRRGGTPTPYLASRIDEMPYCGNALLPEALAKPPSSVLQAPYSEARIQYSEL
jgi:hypothetical protein